MRFNVTPEWVLQKRGVGLQLSKPLKPLKKADNITNIQSIFSLPCNVFLTLNEDILLTANEQQLIDINTDYQKFVGKPISYFVSRHTALSLIKNNQQVIQKNKILFINENINDKDNEFQPEFLSIKLPLYHYQKIIGVLGFVIKMSSNNIATCLTKIQELKLLHDASFSTMTSSSLQIDGINLSIRESECIRLTMRGKTAKEIALLLELSARTVEYYLENIKYKLKVNSKKELIDKLINHIL